MKPFTPTTQKGSKRPGTQAKFTYLLSAGATGSRWDGDAQMGSTE